MMPRFLSLCGLALLLLAGCASSVPAYKRVDTAAPAFRAAVVQEAQRRQDAGESAAKAERNATKAVTAQFIAAEEQRRKDLVAPLLRTLRATGQPAGCWAYTLTTTTRKEQETTVEVATFDPSQPEEKMWTLVSTNGKPPDAKALAAYRKDKAKGKDKKGAGKKEGLLPMSEEQVVKDALNGNFQTVTTTPGTTTFLFDQEKLRPSLVVSVGSLRMAYVVEDATGTLLRQDAALKEVSALGGTFKLNHLDFTAELIVVDPAVPPFVAKSIVRLSGRFLLMGIGEMSIEKVFTNYRRVPCYDDRFQVIIGPLDQLDGIVPSQ